MSTLGYRNQASNEVAVVSAEASLKAECVRKFRAQNVFPQLLHPDGPTRPTLERNADKITTVYIGPDVAKMYPDEFYRIMRECRDLCLTVVQMHGAFVPKQTVT